MTPGRRSPHLDGVPVIPKGNSTDVPVKCVRFGHHRVPAPQLLPAWGQLAMNSEACAFGFHRVDQALIPRLRGLSRRKAIGLLFGTDVLLWYVTILGDSDSAFRLLAWSRRHETSYRVEALPLDGPRPDCSAPWNTRLHSRDPRPAESPEPVDITVHFSSARGQSGSGCRLLRGGGQAGTKIPTGP